MINYALPLIGLFVSKSFTRTSISSRVSNMGAGKESGEDGLLCSLLPLLETVAGPAVGLFFKRGTTLMQPIFCGELRCCLGTSHNLSNEKRVSA